MLSVVVSNIIIILYIYQCCFLLTFYQVKTMSGYLQRFWYTITSNSSAADFAVDRFRTNGMIAGKCNLLFNPQNNPYNVYVVAAIWLADEDYNGDQIQDHNDMIPMPDPDLEYFDLTFQQKQFIVNYVRRSYVNYMGHRENGPFYNHGPYLPDNNYVWKVLNDYVGNPDNAVWTFMSIKSIVRFGY